MHSTGLSTTQTQTQTPTSIRNILSPSSFTSSSSSTTTTTMYPTIALDPVMIRSNITDLIHCLNSRHFHLLPLFLAPTTITYNNMRITPAQYAGELQTITAAAPDTTFHLGQILVDAPNRRVACVLAVEGTPAGPTFRGHGVSGKARKVRYFEQVTWRLDDEGRITAAETTVDEEAVARQCARASGNRKL